MLKKCVLTIVIGKNYNKIFKQTKHNMEMYSKKINADFVVIKNISSERIKFILSRVKKKRYISPQRCVRYCKLFILHDMLEKYDRVIYFDWFRSELCFFVYTILASRTEKFGLVLCC